MCVCDLSFFLGFSIDYVLSLQKCNILQRHNAATWLELAEAYSTLCTNMLGTCERMMSYSKLTKFSNTDAEVSEDDANSSNSDQVESETVKFVSILSNTVILFRPYFKWKNEGNFKQEMLIVSRFAREDTYSVENVCRRAPPVAVETAAVPASNAVSNVGSVLPYLGKVYSNYYSQKCTITYF